MNPTCFRMNMENFAKEKNIPLRDILRDIDNVGLESQRVLRDEGEAARDNFLMQQCMIFMHGFGAALPPGTKALIVETSDE